MSTIISARARNHIQIIRKLFREYEAFLQVDLCFQQFEEELGGLPGKYAAPQGALLLAMVDGRAAGCVAMRPLEEGICEMKRLFVRPAYLGLGIGGQLARTVIEQARDAGYSHMYLDTLETLRPALTLYRGLGFVERPAYYDNPLPGVVYLELRL